MFRNWMRNRLGLDSNAPMGGNQMSPRTMGFENRPMGGGAEMMGNPRSVGFESRPMGGEIAGFNAHAVPYEPHPMQSAEPTAPTPANMYQTKGLMQRYNPYQW